jgi:hypothetical protein
MQLFGLEDIETNQKKRLLPIKEIDLAYRMIENNLLEYLVYITDDRRNPDKKVYMFVQNVYVQDVYNEYYMAKEYKNKRKGGK